MGCEAITNFLSLRGPISRREPQKVNGISPPVDNSRGMEEFRIQIFASELSFSRFVTPERFLLKKEIV
jgi:hypothetical protein